MKIPFRVFVAFLLTAFMTLALTSDPAHADSKKYKRSVEKYNVPDVVLINQDGKKVRLVSLLNSDQPVIMDLTVRDYERLSFGPGQRYVSKGCYIIQLGPGADPALLPQSGWVMH